MKDGELDSIDKGILYYLQQDARGTSSSDIADELDVSASVISDYESGREVMTGERNVYVNAIGKDHDDLDRISKDLDSLGLTVVDEKLVRDEYVCPYHGFLEPEDGESSGDGDAP